MHDNNKTAPHDIDLVKQVHALTQKLKEMEQKVLRLSLLLKKQSRQKNNKTMSPPRAPPVPPRPMTVTMSPPVPPKNENMSQPVPPPTSPPMSPPAPPMCTPSPEHVSKPSQPTRTQVNRARALIFKQQVSFGRLKGNTYGNVVRRLARKKDVLRYLNWMVTKCSRKDNFVLFLSSEGFPKTQQQTRQTL